MSNRFQSRTETANFRQRRFGQSRYRIEDARKKLIIGRIQDARQILNKKKGQHKNKLLRSGQTRNWRVNREAMQLVTKNSRFGMNRGGFIRKTKNTRFGTRNGFANQIRNRQNDVAKNLRIKMKPDVVFQRRRITGTRVALRAPNKRINVRGGSIQITAKQLSSRIQVNDSSDELEDMTFSDLPDFTQQQVAVASNRVLAQPAQMLTSTPVVTQSSTYTILVSNLHPSVTEEDIQELFGAVGTISSTRFLHAGAALVSYLSKEEAMSACSSYHNRLLDSQPMQCSLLPQNDQPKGRTSVASRLGGRLATQSSAHNFARVALAQYIPASTSRRSLTMRSDDPVFNVRLS